MTQIFLASDDPPPGLTPGTHRHRSTRAGVPATEDRPATVPPRCGPVHLSTDQIAVHALTVLGAWSEHQSTTERVRATRPTRQRRETT